MVCKVKPMFEGFSCRGISDFPQNPGMVWGEGTSKLLPHLPLSPRWPWTLPGTTMCNSGGCSMVLCCSLPGMFHLAENPTPAVLSSGHLPQGLSPARSIPGLRKGLTLISFAPNSIYCKFNANTARTRPSSAAPGLLPALRAGQRNYSWERSCAKKQERGELRNLFVTPQLPFHQKY